MKQWIPYQHFWTFLLSKLWRDVCLYAASDIFDRMMFQLLDTYIQDLSSYDLRLTSFPIMELPRRVHIPTCLGHLEFFHSNDRQHKHKLHTTPFPSHALLTHWITYSPTFPSHSRTHPQANNQTKQATMKVTYPIHRPPSSSLHAEALMSFYSPSYAIAKYLPEVLNNLALQTSLWKPACAKTTSSRKEFLACQDRRERELSWRSRLSYWLWLLVWSKGLGWMVR